MKKYKKQIIIVCAAVAILAILAGIAYRYRDRRTYEIDLPQAEELASISIEDLESASGVNISGKEDIKNILNTLGDIKRITEKESVQDIPTNGDFMLRIDFHYNNEGFGRTTFLYKTGFGYYMEQPYNGIYKITREEYESIAGYLGRKDVL